MPHRPSRSDGNGADLLWIGSGDGMEQALVERAGISYRGIATGKVRGINPLAAARNAGKMVRGFSQTLALIRQFNPDVCLTTGGYVCAPVILACRLRRVPILIYLPDVTPGWSIRAMSTIAQRVAVSFAEAATYFGGEYPTGKAVVTGYPVRTALVEAAKERAAARQQLAQALDRPLLAPDTDGTRLPLVFVGGGSQGSRSINQATWAMLPDLLPHAHVLHAVGKRDWSMYEQDHAPTVDALPPTLRNRYHPVAYLHEAMVLALAGADVTVNRAGASTLGEFPVAGLPSILVPLPFAGVNQMANAQTLATHGAAAIVEDDKLDDQLRPTLLNLLGNGAERAAMTAALVTLAMPDAAQRIAKQLSLLSRASMYGRASSS